MHSRPSPPRRLSRIGGPWSTRAGDARWVIASALILTFAIGVLRVLNGSTADAPGVLLIVPVAICAVRFGIRGGLISAGVGMGLAATVNFSTDNQLTLLGYGTRTAARSSGRSDAHSE